jgi:hypothetical protein
MIGEPGAGEVPGEPTLGPTRGYPGPSQSLSLAFVARGALGRPDRSKEVGAEVGRTAKAGRAKELGGGSAGWARVERLFKYDRPESHQSAVCRATFRLPSKGRRG